MTTSVLPAPQAAPPAPPPATRPQPGPPDRPSTSRRLRLRTVPGRIRAWAAAAVVALVVLFALATMAIGDARDGLYVVGKGAGRQVVATADLYYALSDMDTQVANMLLIGEERLGGGREQAMARYEQSRANASEALLQAADLADDDTERATVRSLLNKLGEYERRAGQALLLDDRADHPAGPPSDPEVLRLYREATNLMRLELLPQAYNLTLDNGVIVRRGYEEQHAAVQTGRVAVAIAGLVTLVLLVGLQVYLARRFRRILNPALLAATIVVTVLVGLVMGLLDREAANLRTAKEDGFNSVLALARARAISNSLHGDQSRYLLDPAGADTYEQVYLDKSQRVLHTDAGNLDKYYASLRTILKEYPEKVTFLGLLGDEANNARTKAHRDALAETLERYEIFQQSDRRLRLMKQSDQVQAVRFRMADVSRTFEEYDKSLMALADSHERTLRAAIDDGDAALAGWDYILPAAVLATVALIFVGVRPRLQEYR
jgi:hypothetical protein